MKALSRGCNRREHGRNLARRCDMESIPQRRCRQCAIEKPMSDFAFNGKRGMSGQRWHRMVCKQCSRKGTTRLVDFTGQRIDTWTVIQYLPNMQKWLVRCDRGNQPAIHNS